MSDREKKLVLFFGLAVLILVNFFAFSLYQEQKTKIARKLSDAKSKLQLAEATAGSFDTVINEIEWLGKNRPKPKAGQLVSSELEREGSRQAQLHQITVKRPNIKPNDDSGVYFHRARVEFAVSGSENSFYRWLDKLHMPDQLRTVTAIRLSPDPKDDALIDATVEVEQWYIPPSGDEESPEAESASAPPEPAERP